MGSNDRNNPNIKANQFRQFSAEIGKLIQGLQQELGNVASAAHAQDMRFNTNIIELKVLTSKLQYSYNRMEIQLRMLGAILVSKGIFVNVEEFNFLMDDAVKTELGIDENGYMLGDVIVTEYNLKVG